MTLRSLLGKFMTLSTTSNSSSITLVNQPATSNQQPASSASSSVEQQPLTKCLKCDKDAIRKCGVIWTSIDEGVRWSCTAPLCGNKICNDIHLRDLGGEHITP